MQKNKEMRDSIRYAKRLQDAIIPPIDGLSEYFPENFILYKPKDIVAGDFYWFDKVGDDVFFAAADCTGHGVPGAMLSVLCANAISRTVNEFSIHEPAEILDNVRMLVKKAFESSQREVSDGMDIAFCRLNTKTKKIVFSGAYNSLFHVTSLIEKMDENILKDESHCLVEYKGAKQSIGHGINEKPFQQVEVQLKSGDYIYMSSDGYPDQFGGDLGRKYMQRPFKQLLLSLHKLPISEQLDHLDQVFEDWKGQESQTDDVCLIGVKV